IAHECVARDLGRGCEARDREQACGLHENARCSVDCNHPLFQSAPPYSARSPSCSSMRKSWLYLATRSDRAGAPVLIWPQFVATARSAMVASSVSPLRWDMTAE